MRLLSLRLIVSLIVGITVVSLLSSYYSVRMERRELRRDLARRAELLGESLAANVERSLEKGSTRDLQRIVERFGNREHLVGIAVYDVSGNLVAETPGLAKVLRTQPAVVAEAIADNQGKAQFRRSGGGLDPSLRDAVTPGGPCHRRPGDRTGHRLHCGANTFSLARCFSARAGADGDYRLHYSADCALESERPNRACRAMDAHAAYPAGRC